MWLYGRLLGCFRGDRHAAFSGMPVGADACPVTKNGILVTF